METNYGRRAVPSSPESLAGAVHLFLVDFDRWLAETNQGGQFPETGAGERLTRVRQELTAYPYVALMPPEWNRAAAAAAYAEAAIAAARARKRLDFAGRLALAWRVLRGTL